MQSSPEGAASRAAERIRALVEHERVTVSWETGEFGAQDTTDWGAAARSWVVAPDALIVSDGRPDLTNAQIRMSGAGATLVVSRDASLRGAVVDISAADGLVFIGPRSRLNLVTVSVTGPRGTVIVGAETTWQSGSCLCQWFDQHVVLADDCMLADEVLIRTNDGHGIFDRTSQEKINAARPVVLEPHVWIGRRTTINKGARVGTGTVVGSDSVVSGVLDPHRLYAGVPAREIRENITWSRTHKWDDIPEDYR